MEDTEKDISESERFMSIYDDLLQKVKLKLRMLTF